MCMNETASQSFQPHSIIISVTNNQINHKSTGIKVYSSDINNDVYSSDQKSKSSFESKLTLKIKIF